VRILVAGALGEVGASVTRAMVDMGHVVVPGSSRAPLSELPDVLDLHSAADLIKRREVEGVLVASGRGDRRETPRSGLESTAVLAAASSLAGVPSVLLSTTRVMEGTLGAAEDAPSCPVSPYAHANADNEAVWLQAGGRSILRMTNFFCVPSSSASPQNELLPWSLVHEALEKGTISVRSTPVMTKEFVGAGDVASAAATLMSTEHPPRICATTPGAAFSMSDLVSTVSRGFVLAGHAPPQATYGTLTSSAAVLRPGWLASQGWRASLTGQLMAQAVAAWLIAR